jgi:hypothetical protein
MLLNTGDFLKLFLLINVFSSVFNLASANSEGVCPTRRNEKVQQIDIFDGKPVELAYLAPDDEQTSPNTYTLNHIYEEGRSVTIRCKYDSGFVYDVELKNKVNQCKFFRNKSGNPRLICK